MSAGKEASLDAHRPNVKVYLIVFAVLMVMTVVTVLVSYWHLPPLQAVALGLAIATFKAGLVAFYFMHLKDERPLIYGLLAITAFLLLFLYILPVTDSRLISDKAAPAAPVSAAPQAHEH